MNSRYKTRIIVILVLLVINVLVLTHYELWTMSKKDDFLAINTNECINVIYSDDQIINMVNPRALSDEDGNTTIPNTITISNSCNSNENAYLYLDVYDKSLISDDKMKVSVNGDESLSFINLNKLNGIDVNEEIKKIYKVLKIELPSRSTKRVNFRIWFDDDNALSESKNIFNAKYYISSDNVETFSEKLSNNIDNNLININENKYIKGDYNNNNLKFANMNWKILAINDDNTIKIMYDGNDLESNYTDAIYQEKSVAYDESKLKDYIDNFYKEKLSDYDGDIIEKPYCVDVSSIKTYRYNYGSFIRNFEKFEPSIECSETSLEYGGSKKYKIGLITMDEVAIIGGLSNQDNYDYYLYNGNDYYTMSPAIFNGRAYVGIVTSTGKIDASVVNTINKIRPVINIKGDKTVSGDGSIENPYKFN